MPQLTIIDNKHAIVFQRRLGDDKICAPCYSNINESVAACVELFQEYNTKSLFWHLLKVAKSNVPPRTGLLFWTVAAILGALVGTLWSLVGLILGAIIGAAGGAVLPIPLIALKDWASIQWSIQKLKLSPYGWRARYYFKKRPYGQWFGSYEPVLNGLGSSYYDAYESTALHTDLCSPLATNPTWTKLTDYQQQSLENEGIKLWRSLLSVLYPDLVIVSIARKHLEKMEITEKWKAIYTVNRKNPYTVESSQLSIDEKTTATIIFGKAANTPFGTVSYGDRRKIGSLIERYACGKSRE